MSPNEHQTSTPATPRWAVWKVVVFGQLLAAILAACGITSTALAARVKTQLLISRVPPLITHFQSQPQTCL